MYMWQMAILDSLSDIKKNLLTVDAIKIDNVGKNPSYVSPYTTKHVNVEQQSRSWMGIFSDSRVSYNNDTFLGFTQVI